MLIKSGAIHRRQFRNILDTNRRKALFLYEFEDGLLQEPAVRLKRGSVPFTCVTINSHQIISVLPKQQKRKVDH